MQPEKKVGLQNSNWMVKKPNQKPEGLFEERFSLGIYLNIIVHYTEVTMNSQYFSLF